MQMLNSELADRDTRFEVYVNDELTGHLVFIHDEGSNHYDAMFSNPVRFGTSTIIVEPGEIGDGPEKLLPKVIGTMVDHLRLNVATIPNYLRIIKEGTEEVLYDNYYSRYYPFGLVPISGELTLTYQLYGNSWVVTWVYETDNIYKSNKVTHEFLESALHNAIRDFMKWRMSISES